MRGGGVAGVELSGGAKWDGVDALEGQGWRRGGAEGTAGHEHGHGIWGQNGGANDPLH